MSQRNWPSALRATTLYRSSKDGFMVNYSQDSCPICYETLQGTTPITTTQCGHSYHTECIKVWEMRGGSCPICRQTTGPAFLKVIGDTHPDGSFVQGKLIRLRVSETHEKSGCHSFW